MYGLAFEFDFFFVGWLDGRGVSECVLPWNVFVATLWNFLFGYGWRGGGRERRRWWWWWDVFILLYASQESPSICTVGIPNIYSIDTISLRLFLFNLIVFDLFSAHVFSSHFFPPSSSSSLSHARTHARWHTHSSTHIFIHISMSFHTSFWVLDGKISTGLCLHNIFS